MSNDRQRGKITPALLEDWRRMAREAPAKLARELSDLSLRDQVEAALLMPAGERIPFLTHAPLPMRLVRSLPDGEFYMTVREAGPVDALPLVTLASADQIHHLLDLESWRRDRFDGARAGAWAAVLVEAGDPTLRRFLRNADDELLVLLFRNWARVQQIEFDDQVPIHGPGESEAGDERGFVSPDGYFRFSPVLVEHSLAVRRLAVMLFQEQPERYQSTIWAALNEVPAEVEEAAARWRNSRLEEHGYPPLDEALTVYEPPGDVARETSAPAAEAEPDEAAPLTPLAHLGSRGPLQEVVNTLPSGDRDRFLRRFVTLANRVLVADCLDTGDPEGHRAAIRKSAGYVGLALAARCGTDVREAAATLDEIPLVELFREGYGAAAELQHRASVLVRRGWAGVHPRAPELLDAPIRPRVAGLLEPRPLYLHLPAGEEPAEYREFRLPEEIEETRRALELAEILGSVFVDRLNLDIPRVIRDAESRLEDPPRFSALLLTMMAWHSTCMQMRLEPLPADVASDFLRNVASRRTAPPDAPDRAMDRLREAMSESHALAPVESAAISAFGRACLEELAAECANLDPGVPVTSREVSCLMLATGEEPGRLP